MVMIVPDISGSWGEMLNLSNLLLAVVQALVNRDGGSSRNLSFSIPLVPSWRQVVCGRCSEYKAELQYDKNGPKRVCGECYVFLTGHLLQDERHGKHKGILEVREKQRLDVSFLWFSVACLPPSCLSYSSSVSVKLGNHQPLRLPTF